MKMGFFGNTKKLVEIMHTTYLFKMDPIFEIRVIIGIADKFWLINQILSKNELLIENLSGSKGNLKVRSGFSVFNNYAIIIYINLLQSFRIYFHFSLLLHSVLFYYIYMNIPIHFSLSN